MSSAPSPSLAPAEWFASIVAVMVRMIGARLERPGKPGLAGPLTLAIHLRLQRIRNRITRYCERFRAGTLTPPRPRTRPTGPRRPARAGQWDHLPKLPRGRAWLVRLVPGIGVGASQLEALLAEPEMAAMVAAAPQIGRTLRPFFRMLGREPPPALRRTLIRRPRPAPPPPAAQPAPARRSPRPAAGPPRPSPSHHCPPALPAPAVAAPDGMAPFSA